jgi:hypothetical protein
VRESTDYRLAGEGLQVATGLAQADAANTYVADLKLASYEGIERNPASYEVAASIAWNEFEAVLKLRCLYGLGFDQGEFKIRFRFEERSLLERIAVAFQAHTRQGVDLRDCLHGSFGGWCDMNGFDACL